MKIHIKEKKRFFIAMTISLALLIVIFSPFNSKSYSNTLTKKITVQKGESLWHIANSHYPDENLSKKTYEIAAINNIEDGRIYPGQILILP